MTRGNGAVPGCVMRQHLTDQEYFRAAAGDRLANDLLRTAVAVHLGGVDQRHAKVEPQTKGGDFRRRPAGMLAHAPRALAKDRDRLAGRERDRANVGS